jgi:hypothetical protein
MTDFVKLGPTDVLPSPLAEAIRAARFAEAEANTADKNRQYADEASLQAQEQSKAFLIERDAQYRECGRQIILIKSLYAEAQINRPWKKWIAEELSMSYATVARRMKDAQDPEDATRRRETDAENKRADRNQKSQKKEKSETEQPASPFNPALPIDPTEGMEPVSMLMGSIVESLQGDILRLDAEAQEELLMWLATVIAKREGKSLDDMLLSIAERAVAQEATVAATSSMAITAPEPVALASEAPTRSNWQGQKPPGNIPCNFKDGVCHYSACAGIGCCQHSSTSRMSPNLADDLPPGIPARKPARVERPDLY